MQVRAAAWGGLAHVRSPALLQVHCAVDTVGKLMSPEVRVPKRFILGLRLFGACMMEGASYRVVQDCLQYTELEQVACMPCTEHRLRHPLIFRHRHRYAVCLVSSGSRLLFFCPTIIQAVGLHAGLPSLSRFDDYGNWEQGRRWYQQGPLCTKAVQMSEPRK
jgi:hypothetical protein